MTAIVAGASGGPKEPDSVVHGSGSYTIPAGFFAVVHMNTSVSMTYQPTASTSVTGVTNSNSNNATVTLQEGEAISVSNSLPDGTAPSTGYQQVDAYCRIFVAGNEVCASYARVNCYSSGGNNWYRSTGTARWRAELYAK